MILFILVAKRSIVVGVGYTGHFLNNMFRLCSFIFFSLTFDIVITKPKKFFKNIDPRKNYHRFTVGGSRRADFMLQKYDKTPYSARPKRLKKHRLSGRFGDLETLFSGKKHLTNTMFMKKDF